MTRSAIITDIVACLRAMGPAHGHSLAARQVLRGIHLASELSGSDALARIQDRAAAYGVCQIKRSLDRPAPLYIALGAI